MSTEENPAPKWQHRREIAAYGLDDSAIDDIITRASHAVVSWVTKKNEPVQAVMLYVVLDGLITVTSTTNRAKYHAWRRNPAASFCIWDPDEIGRQVTLRGRIEIMQDDDLLAIAKPAPLPMHPSGSDHTREHIPVLAYGHGVTPGSLGLRESFADIGQSIATHFGLSPMDYGKSFV